MTSNELRLKFLFANQDGVHVVLSFPKTATVAQVKTRLMRSWPENVPSVKDTKAVRFVCMGRGILQDTQKLGSAVPVFDTHPTPVNVSVNYKPQPTVREATRSHVATKTEELTGCGCVIC
ncbi:unnamed protein product [Peronospora effusa]|nr:unnamed protein product [Peronospora effusa]